MGESPARIPFLKMMEQHSLGIELLARVAGVSPWDVFHMANNDPVEKEKIEHVLKAVETLTGNTYTIDEVDVVVKDEKPD